MKDLRSGPGPGLGVPANLRAFSGGDGSGSAAQKVQTPAGMLSPRTLIALALAGSCWLFAACSSEDEERPKANGFGGTGATGTGGSGASGGTAGASTGGASGSGTGGSAGASGSAGAGGSAGSPVDASTDGVTPLDPACEGTYAFWATGAAFTFPTPKDLAKELGALTYDYSTHPVTIVLSAKPNGVGTLQIGATETDSGGVLQVFPAGKKPDPVAAKIQLGGFATSVAQTKAWLRVVDQSGPVDLEIDNVTLEASTASQCNSITAVLTAVIPSSQGSIALALPSGSTTIGALAGSPGSGGQGPDGGSGWNLRMLFTGESTDFDFSSL